MGLKIGKENSSGLTFEIDIWSDEKKLKLDKKNLRQKFANGHINMSPFFV